MKNPVVVALILLSVSMIKKKYIFCGKGKNGSRDCRRDAFIVEVYFTVRCQSRNSSGTNLGRMEFKIGLTFYNR